MNDTIFALATAAGRAAVALVRVSGPAAAGVVRSLAGRLPRPRVATVMNLRSPDGEVLDRGLVLWMPGPRSFTGEDVAEFHVHGGRAVVDAVGGAILAAGARAAEPGEFTRRAFEAGRLDLAQAEAVADLVDAETDAQRRQAVAQLGGALSDQHNEWREALVEILALLEAEIDFPDEDLPDAIAERARPLIQQLSNDVARALETAARGERIRDGFEVAVLGAPNAGKSSLLNALTGREAAIVTAQAGTTRDVVEVPMDLAGYRTIVADTAGIRETTDVVEREGVRRAHARGGAADLRIVVIDPTDPTESWRAAAALARPGDLCVVSKLDLAGDLSATVGRWAEDAGLAILRTSTVTGAGMEGLEQALTSAVVARCSGEGFPAATRVRHRKMLEEALGSLGRAEAALRAGAELAAEDVRLAVRALERITGAVDSEAVLDRVFGSFCIGK